MVSQKRNTSRGSLSFARDRLSVGKERPPQDDNQKSILRSYAFTPPTQQSAQASADWNADKASGTLG
jgi:hypothetical protein